MLVFVNTLLLKRIYVNSNYLNNTALPYIHLATRCFGEKKSEEKIHAYI